MRQKPPSPSTTLSLLLGFGLSKIASKLKDTNLYFCWETSLMACFLVLKLKSEFGVYLFYVYYSVVLVDVCFFVSGASVSLLKRKNGWKKSVQL